MMTPTAELLIELLGNILLFSLVFGMSATVDIACLRAQIKNKRAIATGAFLQFIVLPFLGFVVVKSLNLNHAVGVTLLVVTSSPGGSYSNWWCSMFNADLALSVTMTAISTLLSVITLPLNLMVYARLTFDDDILSQIDWVGVFFSIVIVISAIVLGLAASYKIHSHTFNLRANQLGNFAGISLMAFSAFLSNTDADMQIWDRDWKFFIGVSLPAVLGLLISNVIATGAQLSKPERVTVGVECVYQNVGIATSVALAMFDGQEQAEAMGVPFFYGFVEGALLTAYCLVAWKCGWTKAPKDTPLLTTIFTSYEVLAVEIAEKEENGTEVARGDDPDFGYTQHTGAVTELPRRDPLPGAGAKEPSAESALA